MVINRKEDGGRYRRQGTDGGVCQVRQERVKQDKEQPHTSLKSLFKDYSRFPYNNTLLTLHPWKIQKS